MDKILKFRLWGDYAHFKKYYTTTSPLTFEFPPPPTLIGIISAIIGLDKKEYLDYFQNWDEFQIAVALNNPVKKVRWTVNLIDTKRHFWKIHNRTQIRTEYLKDSDYTIYFRHANRAVYETLKENLKQHNSFYTISLGLSELLANYEFLGEQSITKMKSDTFVEIDSVIPSKIISNGSIDYEIGKEIFAVNFPILMNTERVIEKRYEIIFERNAKTIKCKPENFWQIDSGEKIVFL